MSSGDPSPLEQRLRKALAEEYAARVDAETAMRRVLRALQRAGLRLAEGRG